MPEKDGSEDKKSTKSVINKKQKQFMNQEEQLDLSSVAESFGGRIVGEPVELDEEPITATLGTAAAIKYGIPALIGIGAAGYDYYKKRKGEKGIFPSPEDYSNVVSKIKSIKIPNLGIKDKTKKVFDRIKKRLKPNVEKKADIDNPKKIEKKYNYNRRNKNNQQDIGGPTGGTRGRANNTIDLTKELKRRRKQLNQDTYNKTKDKFFNNKNKKPNFNKRKAAEFGAGAGIFGTGTLVGTQLKKGKLPKFRPRLPQTSHNIGRTSNPQ